MQINSNSLNQDLSSLRPLDSMQPKLAKGNQYSQSFNELYQLYNDKINTKDQLSKKPSGKNTSITDKDNLYLNDNQKKISARPKSSDKPQSQEFENASKNDTRKSNDTSKTQEASPNKEDKDAASNNVPLSPNSLSNSISQNKYRENTLNGQIINEEIDIAEIGELEKLISDIDPQVIGPNDLEDLASNFVKDLAESQNSFERDSQNQNSEEEFLWSERALLEDSFTNAQAELSERELSELIPTSYDQENEEVLNKNFDTVNEGYLNLPLMSQQTFNNSSDKDSSSRSEQSFNQASDNPDSNSLKAEFAYDQFKGGNEDSPNSASNEDNNLLNQNSSLKASIDEDIISNSLLDDEDTDKQISATNLQLSNLSPFAERLVKDASQVSASKVEPIEQTNPIDQIRINIEKAVQADKSMISVVLQPEALGQVDIAMEIVEGKIKSVEISAERNDTLELLQQDVKELQKVLHEVNKSEDASLNFSLKQGSSDNGSNDRGKKQELLEVDRKVVSNIVKSFGYINGYLNLASTPGGINIVV
ncbi:MAG: Flagellar hook-length control protein [Rickettsiaceae bacterium]|jgi:hypothetical protein|nr:Flagellar hook-length control protein [Rickettsiaceae bacterium]